MDLRVVVDDGFEGFLRAWFNQPDGRLDVPSGKAPEPLRRWWAAEQTIGRICAHNRVLPPAQLTHGGSLTTFFVENQGAVTWGFDDDERVFERQDEGGHESVDTGLQLTSFLSAVAVFEASIGDGSLHAEVVDPTSLALPDGAVRPKL